MRRRRGSEGGLGPYSQLLFRSDLQNSLIPEVARGVATPTYTRATTATVPDFEGIIHTALAGEARFKGSRRVHNLITASEDITGNTIAFSAANTTTATTIEFTNATAYRVFDVPAVAGLGDTLACSVVLSSDDMTTAGLNVYGDSGNIEILSQTITSAPTRYYLGYTTSADISEINIGLDNRIANGGQGALGTITATGWQVENVTGQANQNPSEYVSSGVLSSPYHGANVDAVQCFKTLNGNTVSSNVVTEAVGALIGASNEYADAKGPFGYMSEAAASNLTGPTVPSTGKITAFPAASTTFTFDQVPVPDSTISAVKILEAATTEPHGSYCGSFSGSPITTVSNTDYTVSAYVLPTLGRTDIRLSFNTASYTNGVYAEFDLSGGGVVDTDATAIGTSTAAVGSARVEKLAGGWFRLSVAGQNIASAAFVTLHTLNGGLSFLGDITKGCYAWCVQCELGTFASSLIYTTTTAVTRNSDVLTYDDVGNISDLAGTAVCEASTDWSTSDGNLVAVGRAASERTLGKGAGQPSTTIKSSDGSTSSNSPAGTAMLNAPQPIAATWGLELIAYAPGTLLPDLTPASYDGIIGTGDIGVACRNSGDNQWGGTNRLVKIFSNEKSAAEVLLLG